MGRTGWGHRRGRGLVGLSEVRFATVLAVVDGALTAGAAPVLRIDHGFIRALRAEEFQVVEVVGPDHSAIVMDLTLP